MTDQTQAKADPTEELASPSNPFGRRYDALKRSTFWAVFVTHNFGLRFGPFTGPEMGKVIERCVNEKIGMTVMATCGREIDWELVRDIAGPASRFVTNEEAAGIPDKDALSTTHDELADGKITTNQARARFGLEPVDGGDVLLNSVAGAPPRGSDDALQDPEPEPAAPEQQEPAQDDSGGGSSSGNGGV